MTSLYVGNLSFGAREDALRAAFVSIGDVASVHIVTSRKDGRSLGFAFVEMPDEQRALLAAKQLNNVEIDGRPIRVSETRPRNDLARI